MSIKRQWITFAFVLAFLSCPAEGISQNPIELPDAAESIKTTGPAVLWRSPEDIASRNLFYGSGGLEHQPRAPFTFLGEDLDGTSPKITVRDENGVTWKVKLGDEARPETAASRLLWAVGYFTDEIYFLSDIRIAEMPRRLKRGQSQVEPGGLLHNVRLERKVTGKLDEVWQWRHNPFIGTRELNGLRIMMSLINNWDLKNQNTAINIGMYGESTSGVQQTTQRTYLISDLGASFGAPGFAWPKSKSRGNLKQYSNSRFITKSTADYVDFQAPGRPALLYSFAVPKFVMRLRMRWIGRNIPITDAKWMAHLLSRLSPEQIRDAFRSANYSEHEVNGFAQVIESRIAELNKL
jgi:hypothetical protein